MNFLEKKTQAEQEIARLNKINSGWFCWYVKTTNNYVFSYPLLYEPPKYFDTQNFKFVHSNSAMKAHIKNIFKKPLFIE
jgi:hypothetical protein